MKFDYGDTVKVLITVSDNENKYRLGAVCGIDKIDNLGRVVQLNAEFGSYIYTVEFGDGSSQVFAEEYLEKF